MGPVSPFSLPPPFSLLGAFFKATFFSLHPHFQTHLFSSFNLCTSAHLTPFFLGACATALTMATQTRPCWLFSWIWIPCYLPSYSALALGGGGCIFHPLLPLPSLLSFYVLVQSGLILSLSEPANAIWERSWRSSRLFNGRLIHLVTSDGHQEQLQNSDAVCSS